MEGEEKYVGWVRSMGRSGLLDLWARVRKGRELGPWPPGKAFEYLILRAFQLEGAQVIWPYRGAWEQVDVGPIAKLKVRVDRRPPPVIGLFFSASEFTVPAVREAQVQPVRNVLLWQRRDVELALRGGVRTALRVKWRKAVEEAVMDYELKAEDLR